MYRVLLKSMNLVCSGWQGPGPRRSCRGGQDLKETEQEPGLMATYLIGPSSTIDPRRPGLSYIPSSRRPCGLLAAVFDHAFQLSSRACGPSQRGLQSSSRGAGTL